MSEGRLADARLTGYENNLPPASKALGVPSPQLREFRFTADYYRLGCVWFVGWFAPRLRCRCGCDRRDKAVAAPVHGLDEPRGPRVVIQRPAQFHDRISRQQVADSHFGPDRIEQ